MTVMSWWLIAQADAPEPLLPDDRGVDATWFLVFASWVLAAAAVWWVVRTVREARRLAKQAVADVADLRSEVRRSAT